MKKKSIEKVMLIIFLGVCLSIVGMSRQIEDPGVLLRSAIEKEEVDGDLQGAIDLYQQIIEKFSDNQATAAQAQLRIGLCYEKLGQKSVLLAKDAFQKVINNYPSQSDEVRIAKEKLSRLIQIAEKIAKAPLVMTNKKIWAGYQSFRLGAPSPDGRYISYPPDNAVLGLLEIATGKKLLITNKGSRDESDGGALYSRWSADGKQIVYDWENFKDDKIEIRIIGIDGSKPRILYKNEEAKWARTYGWSPDGKQILACVEEINGADGIGQIVLVSTADGSVQVLKTLNGNKGWPENMNFSPDGHYIVYDFQQKENSPEHDISLLSTDGSREIPLVEHSADDYLLGWAPDGENILFASDRTGNLSAWLIAVANGKPQGTPKLVKPGIEQSVPLGFTSDGSFYYTFGGEYTRDIFSVRIDPESGEILNQPKKLIENFEGHNLSPDYSPDGKHLVYVRRMRLDTIINGTMILCIHSLETGEEQEFKLKLRQIDYPRWSPDGKSILFAGFGLNNHDLKLYQFDTQTGNLTALFSPQENHYVGLFEWSHDGKAIFYGQSSKTNNRTQIIRREIESGTEKELFLGSQNERFHFSCSPDGKWLSFFMRGGTDLRIIPVEGGEPRKLFNCNQGDTFSTLRWTADGKYILFVIRPPSDGSSPISRQNKCTLWRIPAEGGEAEKLGLAIDFIGHLSVHPDGQHIAYYNFSDPKDEVWKMENFLPKTKDKK
ncbi:tetratricopeptide repeat protein [Acidobacteriota bacterium]